MLGIFVADFTARPETILFGQGSGSLYAPPSLRLFLDRALVLELPGLGSQPTIPTQMIQQKVFEQIRPLMAIMLERRFGRPPLR